MSIFAHTFEIGLEVVNDEIKTAYLHCLGKLDEHMDTVLVLGQVMNPCGLYLADKCCFLCLTVNSLHYFLQDVRAHRILSHLNKVFNAVDQLNSLAFAENWAHVLHKVVPIFINHQPVRLARDFTDNFGSQNCLRVPLKESLEELASDLASCKSANHAPNAIGVSRGLVSCDHIQRHVLTTFLFSCRATLEVWWGTIWLLMVLN